jgi:hypothetical protein
MLLSNGRLMPRMRQWEAEPFEAPPPDLHPGGPSGPALTDHQAERSAVRANRPGMLRSEADHGNDQGQQR